MRAALVVIACALTMSAALAADKDKVYKWVDDKGVVHYGDKPPDDATKPAKLPPLQTYRGGAPPDLGRYQTAPKAGAAAPAASGAAIQILSPTQDETLRDAEEKVNVSVSVNLAEGARLMYYLDGRASAGPTYDTTLTLTNVERGSHAVAVAAIDTTGKEIARSASVTFYMKPPTATKRH